MFDYHNAQSGKIVVTCLPGHAPALENELVAQGCVVEDRNIVSVTVAGSLEDTVKLNLVLRTASKVLFLLKSEPCPNLKSLYESVKDIPWESFFSDEDYFSIESNTNQPEVSNTMFLNQRVKDAVVDRFMKLTNKRPDSGSDKNYVVLNVRWRDNHLDVLIDTSGQTLAKHNYRTNPYKAPVLESLAAAIIFSINWNCTDPLIVPMCGSGTLAIEAALIASNKYPLLERENFSFMHLKGFDMDELQQLKSQLANETKSFAGPKILASDVDERAIEIAISNAQNAGVEDLIQFDVSDFKECTIPDPPGIILLNPPYGDRLGEPELTDQLYKQIGDFFKNRCSGFTAYIFSANLEAIKHIGLRTSSKKTFYNGPNKARLLQYKMYRGTKKLKVKE
jgi:23S rRNA (guanine2445-N2)-methyltransferase